LATSLRKKCKLLGVPHDPECTRQAVCERDNWICQMCGVQCEQQHPAKPLPHAAEHDHIVALTTPGSPGNVFPNSQCLCRTCNNKKRTRSWGQLRLDLEGSTRRWENGAQGRRQQTSRSCEAIPASVV
jgi:5-methylcytosine-specific restriction endonuclease McrA